MARSVLALLVAAHVLPRSVTGVPDASAACDAEDQSFIQRQVKAEHAVVREHRDEPDAPPTEQCDMEKDKHGCRVSHMRRGQIYDVFPGGGTACLDSSQPYYFQVVKGNPRKLLFFFEDGGFCATRVQYLSNQFCTRKPRRDTPYSGLLNQSDHRNPYRDYSIVRVSYCSGDAHGGNSTQPWGLNGEVVQLRGSVNAEAVLQWAKSQFPYLTNLVLGGYSAGSTGVQGWANRIIDQLGRRCAHISVLADSGVGHLFPVEGLDMVIRGIYHIWGTCTSPALTEEDQMRCKAGDLMPDTYFIETMRRYPKAAFAMINSKSDASQIMFSSASTGQPVTPGDFYKQMTLKLKKYVNEPNFRSFLINGKFHIFTRLENVFEATATGPEGGGNGQVLVDWLQDLTTCSSKWPENICEGPSVKVTEDGEAVSIPIYCDPALVGTGSQ
eukprot:CAMPEP_0176066852 /NCGR_PEP_ID=MMETSP0120_2-20121206/33364_1 /TAXON_ID=160619 /ORGANISM="Kryptoperidinium foliaceum, Strain CCMP 1326" /LENGTH=439 /DNA_ID=CAMNT_0017400461 /DNA_START=53 /DNA_END=1372 /DNA_ORIENTATION=+